MISYLRKKLKLESTNEQISFMILCAICLLYSFSHPYPQVISILELAIGFLLSVVFLMTLACFKKSLRSLFLLSILGIVFFWPLLVGIVGGSSLGGIVRDIIPFLYLCFACLFITRDNDNGNLLNALARVLPWFLTLVGIVFTMKEVLPFLGEILAKKGIMWVEMHLLIQSSAVTFAMCFLLLRGCNLIHYGNHFKGVGLLLLSLIPFIGSYLAVMRAPSVLYLLFILMAFLIWPTRIWRKCIIVGIGSFFFMIASGPNALSPYLTNLTNKQRNHGGNGKIEEVTRITELTLNGPPYIQLFGRGWGSTWASPAVQSLEHPGKQISYAHSFIAYSILKFGLPGYFISILLVVLVCYLFISTWLRIKAFSYEGTVLLSSMPPLLIGIFLEPNYKTLDFSMTLLILIIMHTVARDKSLVTNIQLHT